MREGTDCYPKCSICNKAGKWLEENGIEFKERTEEVAQAEWAVFA